MSYGFEINEEEFTYYGSNSIADLDESKFILDKAQMRDSLRGQLIYLGDGGIGRVVDMTAAEFEEYVEGTVQEGFLWGYGCAIHNDAFLSNEERQAFHDELCDETYRAIYVCWKSEDGRYTGCHEYYDSLSKALDALPALHRELLRECDCALIADHEAGYFSLEGYFGTVQRISVRDLMRQLGETAQN